ncbi:N-acetylneuraminate epimerase [subsurface metagenome]
MNFMIVLILSSVLSQSITWTTKQALPVVRSAPGFAVVNDTVYVIGGSSGGGSLHNTNYVYDPATDLWSTKAPMPTARSNLGCAVVGGKIYAIGGFVGGVQTDTNLVEVYDPASDSWSSKLPMPTSRYAFAIAVVANKIYVIGGMLPVTAAVEEYDPLFDSWATKTAMPTKRMGPACSVIRDTIYVFGGSINVGSKDTLVNECYDPATNNWATKAGMSFNRYANVGFSYNDMAYSVGGYDYHSYFSTVEFYDPVSNSWSKETPIENARQSTAVGLVGNKVYVIGGWNNGALSYNEEGTLTPTAVGLMSFVALPKSCFIEVRWTCPCSDEIFQYVVKRSTEESNTYCTIAEIPGAGSFPSSESYLYKDEDVKPGIRYFYKLRVTKTNGNTKWYGPVSAVVTELKPFLSVSPNPFRKKTEIKWTSGTGHSASGENPIINHQCPMTISIYDVSGRLVKNLSLETGSALNTSVSWDGKDDNEEVLPSGVYYCRLKLDGFNAVKKVLLVR